MHRRQFDAAPKLYLQGHTYLLDEGPEDEPSWVVEGGCSLSGLDGGSRKVSSYFHDLLLHHSQETSFAEISQLLSLLLLPQGQFLLYCVLS